MPITSNSTFPLSRLRGVVLSTVVAMLPGLAACSGETSGPGTTSNTDGSITTADGNTIMADGTVVDGDGNVIGIAGAPGTATTGTGGAANAGGAAVSMNTAGGATVTGAGGTDAGGRMCQGTEVSVPTRLLRLTRNQVVNTVGAVVGADFAATLKADFGIGELSDRGFPPLGSAREGATVTDKLYTLSDDIAETTAQYVYDNFATLTGCTDAPTADCAQAYLATFAEGAFRRPATADELTRITGVYNNTVTTLGGTIQQGVQFGVYAILSAPQFLYRTEFTADSSVGGPLTQYELASQLSYFITDSPPDPELSMAAASNALSTPEQVAAQADRLIASPEGQANLEATVFAYFGMPRLDTVVVDPAQAPEFTEGMRNAMYREGQLFLSANLWNQPLSSLLTSKITTINEGLAGVYGVAWPPASATPDADGFAQVTLPDNRAGILTMPGFLTGWSRPDVASVVGRGLVVNATLLCAPQVPFPEELAAAVDEANELLAGSTERQKADYRASTPPCSGCHLNFDAYGLALDNYDIIGKFRTEDPQGRPIDATVTLPANAGGATVPNAVAMADALVADGSFAKCIVQNMTEYALADTPLTGGEAIENDGCAVQAMTNAFNATTTKTFADVVKSIATSPTFAQRTAGGVAQ